MKVQHMCMYCFRKWLISVMCIRHELPSVLWHCWLGIRKSIRAVKNWVIRCWCGYLSGAWYKWFAYGPADATCTLSFLVPLKSRMIWPFWCRLTQFVLEKRQLNGCLCWALLLKYCKEYNIYCMSFALHTSLQCVFLAAMWNRAGHYIFALWLYLSSSSFLPRLISAIADWMYAILAHMVWHLGCEFRMHVWNVLHAARWKYRMQKNAKNSPSGHHHTTLSGYILATKAHIDSRKEPFKQQYLPHMSLQYGELRPTSSWDQFTRFGHPSTFQRVSRLGSVTARHSSSGRQPNFAALNRERYLHSAGRPSRWALAHILVSFELMFIFSYILSI